jgi:hypothetical protein
MRDEPGFTGRADVEKDAYAGRARFADKMKVKNNFIISAY